MIHTIMIFIDIILFIAVITFAYLLIRWTKQTVIVRYQYYSYRKKSCSMTESEKHCYFALLQASNGLYHIFPQMHFSTFLDHMIVGQNWKGAFSHINQKSVDFLLCEKDTLEPLLAIELDDTTHNRQDRIERDEEEERIFSYAHMPLLRIQHEDSNSVDNLRTKIQSALAAEIVPPVRVKDSPFTMFMNLITGRKTTNYTTVK